LGGPISDLGNGMRLYKGRFGIVMIADESLCCSHKDDKIRVEEEDDRLRKFRVGLGDA
jgi:hypothetical protein